MTPPGGGLRASAATAGVVYFALVFAVGFILGTLRTVALEPSLGPLVATLIEAPLMLTVCLMVAQWLIDRWPVTAAWRPRLLMGLVAFACLIIAEALLSGPVRGWSLAQWFAHFVTPDGALALALYLAFAAIPLALLGRPRPSTSP